MKVLGLQQALPLVAVGFALLLTAVPAFSSLLYLLAMVYHEVGHALLYWLRSIPAIPTFAMAVPLADQRSTFVFLGLFSVLLYAFLVAHRLGRYLFQIVLMILIFSLIAFSWLVPARIAEMWVVYAGVGGEIVLGALGFILFFEQWGAKGRMQGFKYFLLFSGSIVLIRAVQFWLDVFSGQAALPYGALLDLEALSGRESSGDMNRLIRDFGQTEEIITVVYLRAALICTTICAAVYAAALFLRHFDSHRSSQALHPSE